MKGTKKAALATTGMKKELVASKGKKGTEEKAAPLRTRAASKKIVIQDPAVVQFEEDDSGNIVEVPRSFVTPYKAFDLVPLLRTAFIKNPNLSNSGMMTILEPYGKPGVFTNALLQNARQLARMELFGTKEGNVKYVRALKIELEKRGHVVMILNCFSNEANVKHIGEDGKE
jgi:hypothetical protein